MTEIEILEEIKELELKVEKLKYSITAHFRGLPKEVFNSLVDRFNLFVPAGCNDSCYIRFFTEKKVKIAVFFSYQ